MSSASWRPRKAGGQVPIWVHNLRTRSVNSINPTAKQEETHVPTQSIRQRRRTFPSPFSSIQALSRLNDTHPQWGEQSALLNLLSQMPAVGHPVAQWSEHVKLIITPSYKMTQDFSKSTLKNICLIVAKSPVNSPLVKLMLSLLTCILNPLSRMLAYPLSHLQEPERIPSLPRSLFLCP